MAKHGLFDRLAISVQGQRTQEDSKQANRLRGAMSDPKSPSSAAFVAVWSEEGAHRIRDIVQTRPPNQPLFPLYNDTLVKRWAKSGIENMTMKDLRRAGLYHLGHRTGFQNDTVGLHHHARHEKFETTLLYLRRPRVTQKFQTKWDDL